MRSKLIVGVVSIALVLPACSSRPREFAPRLATPAASSAAFDAATAECGQLLVAGKLDSEGRVGSGAVGVAAGAGMAVAGGAAATSAGLYGGAAIASATVVLIPVVAIASAFGMAKRKRAKKERAIKTAMAGCLQERGHQVTGWEKTGRKAATAPTKASAKPSR